MGIDASKVRRILVFHAGALGDVVNALPSIRALQKNFPGAAIDAVGNLSVMALLKEAGAIESALSLDSPGMHSLFTDRTVPEGLRASLSSYDLAVTWIRAPMLVDHLLNAGVKVAALRDRFPPPPGSGHVSDFYARPLMDFGIELDDPRPELTLPEELVSSGPVFEGMIVHPGSGSAKKNWPVDRFAEAVQRIARETGLETGVLEGPADEAAAKALMRKLPGAVLFKDLSTIELAVLLSGAALVVGNDSGVSHLAGALGTPVVAVYGPTDPGVWGVRQDNAANLYPLTACAPCDHEAMWKCKDLECLASITVDRVVEAGMDVSRKGAESAKKINI